MEEIRKLLDGFEPESESILNLKLENKPHPLHTKSEYGGYVQTTTVECVHRYLMDRFQSPEAEGLRCHLRSVSIRVFESLNGDTIFAHHAYIYMRIFTPILFNKDKYATPCLL